MKKLFLLLFTTVLLSCQKHDQNVEFDSSHISAVIAEMTDVMVHDVTNPPLAARFFAYACLAGYEVTAQNDHRFKSMHGILNEYPKIEKPAFSGYSTELSTILAMTSTAIRLQPSGDMLEKFQNDLMDSCRRNGMSEAIIESSYLYGKAVSDAILSYAKTDRYNKISNYPRYTPSTEEGSWYPTPPGYFAPVEPNFNTIRPLTLASPDQFLPDSPEAFSTEKNSIFFKLLEEVYHEGGAGLTKEKREIAGFWDCNPFALQDQGHLMTGLKKISPGAHWMGITGIACKDAKLDFSQSMKVNTMVAISLLDGFIACWDEKFRSNRIRPETAIRKFLDPKWKPLLQTPPFPEYISGHSTISTASAVVLSHYFGNNFQYIDTVEVRYGLPSREFTSFHEAAEEASISRLYGGIHYMDGIVNGQTQGLAIGNWVIKNVEDKIATLQSASNTLLD